jgi:hypothetical protein
MSLADARIYLLKSEKEKNAISILTAREGTAKGERGGETMTGHRLVVWYHTCCPVRDAGNPAILAATRFAHHRFADLFAWNRRKRRW